MRNNFNELDFKYIKNGKTTLYTYLGILEYSEYIETCPDATDFSSWYSFFKKSDIDLNTNRFFIYYQDTVNFDADFLKEQYGEDFYAILQSQVFKNFYIKWFNDEGFLEPPFLDFKFGKYGFDNLSEADNLILNGDEYLNQKSWIWKEEDMMFVFDKKVEYGYWSEKLYIDVSLKDQFISELNTLIELFNLKS